MNAKQTGELLATGVFSYKLHCKDGELLSECVDQRLVSGRYLLGRSLPFATPSGKCAAGAV
jgi:hypothetical protein